MVDTQIHPRVQTRYTRAVNLPRDFRPGGLGISGYQATPLVLQTLGRVMASLRGEVPGRAFSILGPYGAGKSAFGVFLSTFASYSPQARASVLAAHCATSYDPTLLNGPTLLPILIGGNNSSLRPTIMHALFATLHANVLMRQQQPALLAALDAAQHNIEVTPQEVAAWVEHANQAVVDAKAADGMLLMVDELGQYLNHAARHGDERDLFVLQALAEAAAGHAAPPLVVVTILHQSFDRYTGNAGPTARAEWAKVQGRFAELPFQEPASQMMHMVARALWPEGETLPRWQREWGERHAASADELGLRPADISRGEWVTLCARAYPLHPTVLCALPLLFRQLAQNERSLFAFLTAAEPWGLQDAALLQGDARPVYRLPLLYSYVEANLGASLFARARGQRWAELAEARLRLGDVALLARDALTTIGVLNALGQSRGLRADRAQLAFALADDPEDSQVSVALNLLVQRSVIVYRAHRMSYRIWEGSDLDLDELAAQARADLVVRCDLATLLAAHAESAPLVARRFSYQTGAPRLFTPRFVDAANLPSTFTPPAGAEGEICYIIAADNEARQVAASWAIDSARLSEPLRLVVLPGRADDLRELALDVAALDQVAAQPELANDPAARREVRGRLLEARAALSQLIAFAYGPQGGEWFWQGAAQLISSERALDDLLFAACASAYPHTPRIWNELIVRRQLSSAAARARRVLIEAMLDHGHEPGLGLQGFPPERAVYESVLAATNIHRPGVGGLWVFGAPPTDNALHVRPAWDAIEAFFDTAEASTRPLLELYHLLEAPPYGIKAGLVPLLFMAAYLANSGEIALYEHGSYAPIPDMALFERMLRQPGYFAVRRSRISFGVRVAVFERLARVMAPKALQRSGQTALLDAVTPLLRIAHTLPAYARTTASVSPQARAIRSALLGAGAPDELLFAALPRACEVEPFTADTPAAPEHVDAFFAALRGGLEELRAAYSHLSTRVAARIGAAFLAATSDITVMRDELLGRYHQIAAHTADTQIRALGVRLEHADPGPGWIESVAALVGHKPLNTWGDSEVAAFDLQIADLGQRFRLAEQLAFAAKQLPPETRMLRVAVADGNGERSVIVQQDKLDGEARILHNELETVLAKYQAVSQHQRAAAIAALLQALLQEE